MGVSIYDFSRRFQKDVYKRQEELSEKTESDVVQVIGSRLVLFKRNPKEPVIEF